MLRQSLQQQKPKDPRAQYASLHDLVAGTRPLHTKSQNSLNAASPPSDQNFGAIKPVSSQKRLQHTVKRTDSFLHRIGNSGFEDETVLTDNRQSQTAVPYSSLIHDSHKRQKTIPSAAKAQSTNATIEALYDSDDFNSEFDLDDGDPPKSVLHYPNLPEAPPSGHVHYPELPQSTNRNNRNFASHHGSENRNRGASIAAEMKHKVRDLPDSSDPLPWSSSAEEHFHKAPGAWPAGDARTQQPVTPSARLQSKEKELHDPTRPPPSSQKSITAFAKPTKKRVLPWEGRSATTSHIGVDGGHNAKRVKSQPVSTAGHDSLTTPAPKKEYPWNATASAMKEQQKTHRQKSTFKPVTTVEGNMTRDKKGRENKKIARIFLSDEQNHVLSLVEDKGKSIFFTGAAGTGKSVLLREIIKHLRKRYSRETDRVAVCASTGLAACTVGGVTLHSFAGIGLGKEPADELVKRIKKNQKAKNRWKRVRVLVIDEVSMVDGDLFDKLEAIARNIRNNGRPFGGIQLVVTGDFFQLPPVPDGRNGSKFCFEAGTWNTTIDHTIKLNQVFRQSDSTFANMLNEMREGRMSQNTIATFKGLNRPIKDLPEDQQATELFPLRAEVDRANWQRMHALKGEVLNFEARDGGALKDVAQRTKALEHCMAPATLQLKVGAQVMLIKNLDEQLVNGSVGTVVGFMSEASYGKIEEDGNDLPPSTAAALSRFGDMEEDEDPDMAALRNADRHSNAKIRSKLDAFAFDGGRKYPYVRFTNPDKTFRMCLVKPEQWKVEEPNGEVRASRTQVPLILAWALSIHKAQGQTLEFVKVDLTKAFEKGQAYVALSRATSLPGLQVMNFSPQRVQVHELVRRFYDGLACVGESNKPTKRGWQEAESAYAEKGKSEEVRREFAEYDDGVDDEDFLKAVGGY